MRLHQKSLYWKLLDNPVFSSLHNILDYILKEKTAQDHSIRKSCDVVVLTHENKVFRSGASGESYPEQLLRTVIYVCAKCLLSNTWGCSIQD